MDLNNLWSDIDLSKYRQNTRCLSVNTILAGKYLVGPVLGQGGFGITYMGYDLNMDTRIAIKEYFPVELVSRDTTTMHGDRVLSLSGEKSVTYQQGLKKYVTEAQNVSQFSEVPGIVSVKDFFYENETAYIVMEYIDGISLKDYLKERGGRLSEEETLAIMKPVLEALEKVHNAGIIHRDISPDNIMLTFEENHIKFVKLIDFGAARMTAKNDQKSLTIILKHGYAPEEQYRTHGEQGPWTDVYAVCAVMYRMLTGETPVPAMDRMFKDELKSFEEHGFEVKAALNQGNADKKAIVSQNTAAAILKGLAVKKDDRIQSMGELTGVLYGGKWVSAGIRDRKKRWLPEIGIAAVLLTAVVVMVCVWTGRNRIGAGGRTDLRSDGELLADDITDKTESSPIDGIQESNTEAADFNGEIIMVDDRTSEEALGEQIAYYTAQNSIAGGEYSSHILFCKPDGTVEARGENTYGQCNVEEWTNIVSVKVGAYHSLGLRSDGTVVAAGDNDRGQCDVMQWTDVVSIAAGEYMSFGISKEGNVLVAGAEESRQEGIKKVAAWTDIKAICCNGSGRLVIGLKTDGTVVYEKVGEIVYESAAGYNFEDIFGTIDNWQNVADIDVLDGSLIYGIEEDGTVRVAHNYTENDNFFPYIEQRYGSLPKMKQVDAELECGVTVDGKVTVMDSSRFADWTGILEEVEGWTDMVSVSGYTQGYFYGLKEDGTICEVYINQGNDSLEEFVNLEQVFLLDEGIVGQQKNGSVLYYGGNFSLAAWLSELRLNSQIKQLHVESGTYILLLEDGMVISNEDWLSTTGIAQIVGGEYGSDWAFLTMDGTIELYLGGGDDDWDNHLREEVKDWKDIVYIWGSAGSSLLWGLKSDGSVVCTTKGWEMDILGCSTPYADGYNVFGLTDDGRVKILWDDSVSTDSTGRYNITGWTDIAEFAIGGAHSVGLKKDGTVVAVGANHCGQCDVEDWKNVVSVDAAGNCTIGVTKDGRLLMAGSLY